MFHLPIFSIESCLVGGSKMVVSTTQVPDYLSFVRLQKPNSSLPNIPTVDLSRIGSEPVMVRACEELGFFKVVNHGVHLETASRLEAQANKFFSNSQVEKEKFGVGNKSSFLYGSNSIGQSGDVGWLEYLIFRNVNAPGNHSSQPKSPDEDYLLFCLRDYITEMKNLACSVLEKMVTGMRVKQRDILSRMVMDDRSDTVFRVNHYPPCPVMKEMVDFRLTAFGEHTDPQIISVLRSNNTNGLQISLKDGRWVSVPSDKNSFFILVGDSLQVLTNGRFRSVRHRVIANTKKPRVSMVYFGGPPNEERIGPLPLLMGEGEESHYKEFTWSEYKTSASKSRLADDRLLPFHKKHHLLLP